MISFIIAIILLLLSIGGVVLRKTYYYLPEKELKRLARQNDELATQLYRAVGYGSSLRAFLWIFIATTSAAGFVLLARIAPIWLSLTAVILLLWMTYSWLPATRVTSVGARLTTLVTPGVAWLLSVLHPVLGKGAHHIQKRYSAAPHTGMFEREDLLNVLEKQELQQDSRINTNELAAVKRALAFSDQKISNVLTDLETVKVVNASDTVGPILIDEVHRAAQPFVLVSGETTSDIIGTLSVEQLGLKSSGRVLDFMSPIIYYLNEQDTLPEALDAFYETNCPLFVVINSSKELVGVVGVEAILSQLVGQVTDKSFDQFTDISAVAERHNTSQTTEEETSGDFSEDTTTLTPETVKIASNQEDLSETDETMLE